MTLWCGENGTVQRLMYEQSHRDYLRSGYLHHRLPVWAVNHYRDNAITYKKPSATKMLKAKKLANAAITDEYADAISVMLLRSMQNTREELADAKAENDALRDDVAAGRRRLHIKAVCRSVREIPPPPGVDIGLTPTGSLPEQDCSPSERRRPVKTTGRSPEVY